MHRTSYTRSSYVGRTIVTLESTVVPPFSLFVARSTHIIHPMRTKIILIETLITEIAEWVGDLAISYIIADTYITSPEFR